MTISLSPASHPSIGEGIGTDKLISRTRIPRRTFLTSLVGLAALPWNAGVGTEPDPPPQNPAGSNAKTFTLNDPAYELKRQGSVWQAMKPDRRPALIVEPQSERDIIETLRHAQAENRPITVRAGGHSYIATFLRNDSILLDVSAFQDISISADRQTVTVGPGVRGAMLDAHLAEQGLAFPVAHVGSVGMGGFLLGGGMGWNGESWGGMACLNIHSVDLITADGQRLTVSPDSHPDLFWAARGAGPAFCAVATRYRLSAFPRPDAITRSSFVYPIGSAVAAAQWLQQAAASPHPNVELTLVLVTDEQMHTDSARPRTQSCRVSVTCFADTTEQSNSRLDAIVHSAPVEAGVVREERREVTIGELLAMSNTGAPRRIAADNVWTDQPVETLSTLVRHFAKTPSPDTVVIANFRSVRSPGQDAACTVMASSYVMWLASWDDAPRDTENLAWVGDAARLVEPYTAGCYINETDFLARPDRAARSFSAENWRRLHAVKTRYDPRNSFRPPFQ